MIKSIIKKRFDILGLLSIPWDLHEKDSAKQTSDTIVVYEILLFKFLQHSSHDVKCKPSFGV